MRFIFIIFTLLVSQSAFADTSIYGSLFYSKTSDSTENAGQSLGGGVELTLTHFNFADLNVAFEFQPRSINLSGVSTSLTYINVPLSLRFWLGKIITLSVGFYGAYHLSGGDSALPSTLDYGFQGKGGFHFPITEMNGVILEGGYVMGLSTLLGTQTGSLRQTLFSVGIRFRN